jgi:hypothetical protein
MRSRIAVLAVLSWLAAAALVVDLDAHKPITSRYTYNDDVLPIVRERCGRCHVPGGVGAMSLLSYKDAYPWAESIRQELLAMEMPPWHADEGFGRGVTLHTLLSPRELDVLLVWATGGTPQGAGGASATASVRNEWPSGEPHLVLTMPEAFVLAPDIQEATHRFVVETGLVRDRFVRSVALRPGNPAIVRHATFEVVSSGVAAGSRRSGDTGLALAEWTPGSGPLPPSQTRLRAGARLRVTIHYKRTWSYEGAAVSDRSSVGIYFKDAARE